jgi:hypothetical protein
MLCAAAIVSCNNEVIGPNNDRGGGEEIVEGETTYATFILKAGVPSTTYAGGDKLDGSGREDIVGDAVLAIYKASGDVPEAVAYINDSPENKTTPNVGNGGKVTLKCKTGLKTVYLAVNVGSPVGSAPTGASSILVYANTNKTTDNASTNPGVTEQYEGAEGTLFADTLNALIVALASDTYTNDFKNTAFTATAFPGGATGTLVKADGLIRGLTGAGTVAKGVLSGDGDTDSRYLMSNWKGDDDIAGAFNNNSTSSFNLVKVTAAVSRPATAGEVGANAFTINVQRAVAKVALNIHTIKANADTVATGTTRDGLVVLATGGKYAVGNLAKAAYPFQQFDGSTVKSPAYNCSEGIATASRPLNQFKRFMDNSRIYGNVYDITGYSPIDPATKTTVQNVTDTINSNASNVAFTTVATPSFAATDYTIVTENNHVSAYNAYSSYVIFTATYQPAEIIIGAPAGSTDATVVKLTGTQPSYTSSSTSAISDTLYYVRTDEYLSLKDGKFFYGSTAILRDYMENVLQIAPATIDQKLASWGTPNGVNHAALQKYYNGKCFYRVWIKDEASSKSSEKFLVRRNHAYQINVSAFDGPGIADPHGIIDPDPTTGPEELEESDTYVTATINVLPWHTVEQDAKGGLN